ncbi:TPA: tRNA (adenosine(37)-N6)-threonylcarbamoyltransferase complex ATPase subunit type 1 TsaE [Streptococcus pyogenes]|uniref:tRNA (adenosine(37)-N6)-threonylcarbamoyltransferase complex ATPase subunit type 1 TsaE n=1 Tax=Streptococcus pyogenes TaxID=1314 RepID=UPI00109D8122|nr:tRNA (adenosine(37)-N6)-threonylcarbamoyltransferase complex ATPase subunit type 1 TsaE [Streptococcus pyogenes]VGZ23767.1 P-loop hydrolase [Streptococcus pyogenes]VHA06015.1 P-loop hydrolase [Streptococcus pyogenes]HEQ4751782.1 tRNA (adenosine(37)-N6)-threonylcarbamoyltransferase complex ATPase subunit type 1 TsaE [Streptococcus pyogenes]HEQ9057251.1 tRNA (adenosine(37)-N6)-threonylcarbamoyltransferase complex ATPase subunit type 1 TsaE [Streptococcus pyogenes]
MFYSENEYTLKAYGATLGTYLSIGDVIVLSGDLGAGKTTLAKGIAKGMGISQMIKSPTYTIVREYEGRLPLYHLDIYRVGDDPDSIDLDDFLFGNGVTVIEWGELLGEGLLQDYLQITITKRDKGRQLDLLAHGERSRQLLEIMSHDAAKSRY